MRLSAAVMAHPIREIQVARQAAWLDRDVPVVWAANPQPDPELEWATARAAWLQYNPSADWHVVLQDDAMPCRDLLVGLEVALGELGSRGVVSAYVGTGRPAQAAVVSALSAAQNRGHAWMSLRSLNWGVAVCVPVGVVPAMVEWCDRAGGPYDRRVARYVRDVLRWRTWYTVPSLVDHADGGSLIGHGAGRVAHMPHDGSALDVDWSAHDGLPVGLEER